MNKRVQFNYLAIMFFLCFSKNFLAGGKSHSILHLHEYSEWMDEYAHMLHMDKAIKREVFFTEELANE